MTYANGAYDAVVTTRPGATFFLAPTSPGANGMSPSASAGGVCTAGTKGVQGMLTTYSLHCPGEQNAATLLIVRVAGGGSGASVATPLAVGTTP
ncbi:MULTISPECIES: hypothetical protein [Dermacoccus]|uniref:Uncharacterized protein n=1 Tax=Dermacoccus nishinomiyaensis TaxID=1274 RepID=A0A075JK31_9MICO|nr:MULTISPECIES: hypothetical protein [Dermacoccus]AIF40443.1 hypothetical protein HX89_05195 [Dermacoccus nishinomiyaensis]EFP57663.1 hypothetical protein HMPREF0321_2828 [Dermacoccus sp. Ellin185]MBO1759503.1 hypothetical protein [Dermacoccus sp. NHGro5]MCG7429323.1 hypothetical protein [Dermacoccus nishinomiyaensis]PZP01896.1 MAG: hypothetical protein DI618_05135 [Dermacoccus nishinomiyaensis]